MSTPPLLPQPISESDLSKTSPSSPDDGERASIWHPSIPGLQVVWDATSLRTLQECPRKYQFAQVEGWRSEGESMDLLFGGAVGDALEHLYKEIIENGKGHEAALQSACHRLLALMWDDETGPKTGFFDDFWHCEGTTPYKNAKGNKAKCPFSHKGKFFLSPAPATCSCGSPTRTLRKWISKHATKDIYNALRMLVWYADDMRNVGHLEPLSVTTESGQHVALCEVPFQVPVGNISGVPMALAGWFDSVKRLGDDAYVTDYKTTKHTLSGSYWGQYWPNPQVGAYDLVASQVMTRLPYAGVAIEAFQVLKGGIRYGFRTFSPTLEQRAEFSRDLRMWLSIAVAYNSAGYYPQNPSACKLCQFHAVCAARPEERGQLLRSAFKRERWNPLTRTSEPVVDAPSNGPATPVESSCPSGSGGDMGARPIPPANLPCPVDSADPICSNPGPA